MTTTPHGTEPVTVSAPAGAVRGWRDGEVFAFLGIPYAQAPYGERRLRPPVRYERWSGARDALVYGPTCPQRPYPPLFAPLYHEVTVPGEDCLNLNIWTPDLGNGGLPVLVWIHGGAFVVGSGANPWYNGTAFARSGVVCVSINYRLGAEGFAYTPDGTANLGLLDQLAALEWVQENIAAFGGDPAHVTVAGQSAGGLAVTTLLSMPSASGLFRGVIAAANAGHALSVEEATYMTSKLAGRVGSQPTREGLGAVPVEQLTDATASIYDELAGGADPDQWEEFALSVLPVRPVIDGSLVPGDPLAVIASGQGSDVAVLAGTNAEEGRVFVVPNGAIEVIDETALAQTAAAYGLSDQAVTAYRDANPAASPGDLVAAIAGDWFIRIPTIRLAEAHSGSSAGTWMYEFQWRSDSYDGTLGSVHGIEVPFAFQTIDVESARPIIGTNPSPQVADAIHRSWIRFITDADPGWPRYTPAERTTALIDSAVTTINDPHRQERETWEGIR